MKQTILLILCCFMLNMGVCSAEIRKGQVDEFDGSLNINSLNYNIGEFEYFNFYREKHDLNSDYSFYVRKDCVYERQLVYAVEKVQIKVDDAIYDAKILKQNTRLKGYSFRIASGDFSAEIEIDSKLIEVIKQAETVIVRFTYNNGIYDTIDIPDEVLTEWKQVINMEK